MHRLACKHTALFHTVRYDCVADNAVNPQHSFPFISMSSISTRSDSVRGSSGFPQRSAKIRYRSIFPARQTGKPAGTAIQFYLKGSDDASWSGREQISLHISIPTVDNNVFFIIGWFLNFVMATGSLETTVYLYMGLQRGQNKIRKEELANWN